MKIHRLLPAAILCLAAPVLRADPPMTPVTAQEMYPVAQLREAQRVALAQGKPVGFLLTWPMYFPGAPDFHRNSSTSTTYFYHAFKDQAVLVNVNHATGELDHLPPVALDAFRSPAEGGYAPCLCLTNPTFTKLIGIIPLWENPAQREEYFARYQALIADKSVWWDAAAVQTRRSSRHRRPHRRRACACPPGCRRAHVRFQRLCPRTGTDPAGRTADRATLSLAHAPPVTSDCRLRRPRAALTVLAQPSP